MTVLFLNSLQSLQEKVSLSAPLTIFLHYTVHQAYQLGHNAQSKFHFCKRKFNIREVRVLLIILPSINMLMQTLRRVLPNSFSVVCSKSKSTSKRVQFFVKLSVGKW